MPDHLPPAGAAVPPVLDALLGRASVPVRTLRDPVPPDEAIDRAVAAALRAPDHGGLKPWRFLVFRGEARRALGDALVQGLAAREPEASPERIESERAKPMRAPMVVVIAAALRHNHKIPLWEQEACVAAGAANLQHALEAMGWGTVWLSSAGCREPAVARALGLPDGAALLGWLNVGTAPAERPAPQRPDPSGYWREWRGGGGPDWAA